MNSAFFIKFFKFISVGGLGFGLDMLTTWILKDKLQLKKYISNSIGFTIGMVFRYILNRIWTFQSDNPKWVFELISFMAIAAFGLLIVNYVIKLLTDKWKLMSFYPAKVCSMIVFFIYNFTANYFITFGATL